MNNALMRLIPLAALLILCLALAFGLYSNSGHPGRASNLVGKKMEAFSLPSLRGRRAFSSDDWSRQVAVLNVFASWCEPCATEAPVLLRLTQSGRVPVYGLAWKDNADSVSAWLDKHGNPYRRVGIDQEGSTTLPLALTGVPETFVLNRNGDIVYQYQLPLTDALVNSVILPLVDKLNSGDVQ